MTPKKLPALTFQSTEEGFTNFKNLKGQNVVLYFYPKDDTPGCTIEAIEFTAAIKKFAKLNTVVIGVSRDSVKSHAKFCEKHSLGIPLISDEEEVLCHLFGVMKDKNMYGKKVRGVDRSTFLFDVDGKLLQEWRGVKVDGHVAAVLASLQKV